MNPQAEANTIYNPALQNIQAQMPQVQQLYQTLVQGLQQQSMAQQQNVVNSAQQRGVGSPMLAGQVAGALNQEVGLQGAQINSQRAQDLALIQQQLGKTNVSKGNAVYELANTLQKQNMENQQNAYQMTDIERKAQLEQQQNSRQAEIQKTRFDVAEQKRRAAEAEANARAYSNAVDVSAKMDLQSFTSNMQAALTKQAGGDGKVSPTTFRQAMLLWQQKGLPTSEFINTYGKYINQSHAQDYYKTSSVVQSGGSTTNINQLRF